MSPIKRKCLSAIAAGTALAAIGALAAWPAAPGRVVAVAETSPSVLARQLAQGVLSLHGGGPLQTRLSAQDVRAAKTLARGITASAGGAAPPHTAECRVAYKVPCFSVRQLARAYGVDNAHRAGWTGKGVTVVFPIWYGSPTLKQDLARFSAAYGLPAPNIEVRKFGTIPPMPAPDAPDAPFRYAVAEEAVLDMSLVHGMAPDAKLVALVTPGNFDGPDAGYAEILHAMRSYARTHPGAVFSQSYGIYEADLPARVLRGLDRQIAQLATQYAATMIVANGDTGNTSGTSPDPAVPWPASSPHVTAVAGTRMHLTDAGTRIRPDTVWDDSNGIGMATGGGLSAVFARPPYQKPYRNLVGRHRGVADIAANGSGESRVVFYSTYNVLGGQIDRDGGWRRAAGTSVAAPLIAGITALARQAAHRPLGTLNPTLYRIVATPRRAHKFGIADVTTGCNSVPGNQGWCARPSWDPVSGVGTIGDAARLVPALAGRRTSGSSG
ncbi:kumamolisin [Actinomadura pelletieri DSM 43383]|uniref:Kumamolisin n=1 Tax=Actinomadura pelletieri DSM 43383 TaxID=1120940 RepID=A0A495Q9D9_9ACTN|nr:S53 family peptidase [Actinomadura pelletieri]RKS68119.1 kumamolisin [Actinomadura pelletieri DSM 43383]